MPEYLVFQLYGPMAAWGDIAVGETRRSTPHPAKSAILGLLAAALGIDRQDEERHTAMATAYGMAFKTLSIGSLLLDYHTVQVPPRQSKAIFRTRKDELAADKVGTLLSSREYRCDAAYIVAVWADQDRALFSLQQLAEALQQPRYTLYLGRKSCPPAYPLHPEIIQVGTLKEALDSRGEIAREIARIARNQNPLYYWDDTAASGLKADQRLERWDLPRSRRRWQFGPRLENLCIGKKEE